jgi:hypothetical protein
LRPIWAVPKKPSQPVVVCGAVVYWCHLSNANRGSQLARVSMKQDLAQKITKAKRADEVAQG